MDWKYLIPTTLLIPKTLTNATTGKCVYSVNNKRSTFYRALFVPQSSKFVFLVYKDVTSYI